MRKRRFKGLVAFVTSLIILAVNCSFIFAASPDSWEPNDTPDTAYDITAAGSATTRAATIHTSNDLDYYKFTLSSSNKFIITLIPPNDGIDFNIAVWDITGTATTIYNGNFTPAGQAETFEFNGTEEHTYQICVYTQNGASENRYYLFVQQPK